MRRNERKRGALQPPWPPWSPPASIHQLLEESEAKKGDPAEKAAGQLLKAAKAEELEFQEVDDILLDVGDLNLEDLDVNAPEVKEILTLRGAGPLFRPKPKQNISKSFDRRLALKLRAGR